MARRTSRGRKGAVAGRIQVKNPVTKRWVKVNTKTGRIVSAKKKHLVPIRA